MLLASALLAPTLAIAATAPSFPALMQDAAASSPRLSASRFEVDAAEGQEDQAGARPNPTVRLDVENFAGHGPLSGLQGSEVTLAVEQPLEIGGQRRARVDAARGEVTVAVARVLVARVDFAHDLALAYIEVEATQERLAIANEAVELAEADAATVLLLVKEGREAQVREVQALAAVGSARAEREQVRGDLAAALGRLNALAMSVDPYTGVAGGLLDASLPRATTEADPPLVVLARAERDASRQRINVERRKAAPDMAVSLGVRRFEDDDATALVGGASVSLPLFDRNRGGVASSEATARAADARLAQAMLEAEAGRRAALAQLSAAESQLAASRQGQAAAEEAYRLARLGYDAGKLQLVETLAARRTFIEAKMHTLDARLARGRALIALARAEGRTIAGELS